MAVNLRSSWSVLILVFLLGVFSLGAYSADGEGVLKMARARDGGTLNPLQANTLAVSRNVNLFYNQLVNVDPKNENKLVPGLLVSWETEDYGSWTLHLREGVEFHDGAAWNAEALKFNLDMWAKSPEASYMTYQGYATEGGAQVVDEYTLKLELNQPVPLMMHFFQASWYSIVSPKAVQENATEEDPYAGKWLTNHEAGSGPFILEEWKAGDRLVADRWEDYWGGVQKTSPKVEKLLYLVAPEPSVRMMMLERGEIDVTMGLNRDMYERLEGEEGFKVETFATASKRTMIFYDVTAPPFSDLKVRKAVNYAINYEEIINQVERGQKYAEKLSGIPPAGFLGGRGELADFYPYDPAQAKELLEESDYPDGFKTVLFYDPERYSPFDDYALFIQSYLGEIGIDVEIQKVTLSNQLARQEEGDYGMGLMIYSGDSLALSADGVRWQYCSDKDTYGWRGNHWKTELTEKYCPRAISEPDREKRAEMYERIDRIAHEQAIYVYLTRPRTTYAMRDGVQGFFYSPPYQEWLWSVELG